MVQLLDALFVIENMGNTTRPFAARSAFVKDTSAAVLDGCSS